MSALPDAAVARLAPYRAAYAAASIPYALVPGAVSDDIAAHIRARLAGARFERIDLAHRGKYAYCDDFVDEPLFQGLAAIASHLSGERLAIAGARWKRLLRGDYALTRDDVAPMDRHVEVILDVSAEPSGGGEVCYCHRGAPFLAVPASPGGAAIIERGATIRRYDRYRSCRTADVETVRLYLSLRIIDAERDVG